MELKSAVQYYDWGKPGETSEVALLANVNSGVPVEDTKTYAELWMGTHPSGPSVIKETGKSLKDHIKEHPDTLGPAVHNFPRDSLPFLLKVLSINKPLSIQAHPTKKHAEALHASQPEIYKDDNHKPEMAIALTPFEALCGFRPVEEIKTFFKSIPELESVIGVEQMSNFINELSPETLKECFNNLMTADAQLIKTTLQKLMRRLYACDEKTRSEQCAVLVERLHKSFPGDVGVFGIYFFNYLQLKQGEAIFLPANEPHAYLSGDCVECMACSDNVVRAGLTPKLKDVNTLVEMLTYDCAPSESKKFVPTVEDDYTLLFTPPVPDFGLAKITVKAGDEYELKPRDSASIFIVIRGSAECSKVNLKRGSVIFLAAKETLNVKANQQLILYQAFTGKRKDSKSSENTALALEVTGDVIVVKEKIEAEKTEIDEGGLTSAEKKKARRKRTKKVAITSPDNESTAPVRSSTVAKVGGGITIEASLAERRRLKRKRQKERRRDKKIAELSCGGVLNNPPTAMSNPPTVVSDELPKKKSKPELSDTQVAGRGCIVRVFTADGKDLKIEDFDHIGEFIESAIQNNKNSPGKAKFRSIRHVTNCVRIVCEDSSSMEWAKIVLRDLPKPNPDHPGFSVITSKDQRMHYSAYYAWFKKKYTTQHLLSTLQACNRGIVAAKMYIQNVVRRKTGFSFLIQIHKSLNPLLKKLKFKLKFGVKTVPFLSYIQVKNESLYPNTVFKSTFARTQNPNIWTEPARTIRNHRPFERAYRKVENEPRSIAANRDLFRKQNNVKINPSYYQRNTRRQDLLGTRFSRRMNGGELNVVGKSQNFSLRNNPTLLKEEVNPDEDDLRNVLNRNRFGTSNMSRSNNEFYRFVSEGDHSRFNNVWRDDRNKVDQHNLDPLKRVVVTNYQPRTLLRNPDWNRVSNYNEPRETFQSSAPLEQKWKNENWNYRQPTENWEGGKMPWERGNGNHDQGYRAHGENTNNPGPSVQYESDLAYTKPMSQPLSIRERLNMSDQNNINWDSRKRMRSPEPYVPKPNRSNSPNLTGKRLKYSEHYNTEFNRPEWNSNRLGDGYSQFPNNDNKDWSNQGRVYNNSNFNQINTQFGNDNKPTNLNYNNDFKYDYNHRTNPEVFPERSAQFGSSSGQSWIDNEPKMYHYNQVNNNESVREPGSNIQLTLLNERYYNEKATTPSLLPPSMFRPMGSQKWSPPLRRPGSPPLRRPGSPSLLRLPAPKFENRQNNYGPNQWQQPNTYWK